MKYYEFSFIEKIRYKAWYFFRPKTVKQIIDKYPPYQLYKFKDSGKQCIIMIYDEPKDKSKEITLTVQKTGIGGHLNENGIFAFMDKGWNVFGVKPTDIEPWDETN